MRTRTVIGDVVRRGTAALVAALAIALLAAPSGAAQAPGDRASGVDLGAVSGAVAHGPGHAIPLAAELPDWYTAALHERVLAAEGEPLQAPNDAPLPSAVGVRPGAWMLFPAGCTMNFVFASGDRLAIGTAGHCADVGEEVVIATLAPGSGDPVLVRLGEVIMSRDEGVGEDFALVEIDPELHDWVSPTTALVGGPCGRYAGSGPETVAHYGHGVGIGTGGTPRVGVAPNWRADAYGWLGAGIFGDSGSPVRVTDFAAAGNLTHLVVDTNWLPSYIVGTRIQKMEQLAGGWQLVSSPICPLGL